MEQSNIDAYIYAEKIAVEKFDELVRQALEYAEPISGRGDGNGGYLIERFMEHMQAFGYWKKPTPTIRKKAVIPTLLRTKVFERDLYKCRNCGTHLDLTVDHIVPESLGGSLDMDNLQTLCKSCNSSKGVKPISEWRGE